MILSPCLNLQGGHACNIVFVFSGRMYVFSILLRWFIVLRSCLIIWGTFEITLPSKIGENKREGETLPFGADYASGFLHVLV